MPYAPSLLRSYGVTSNFSYCPPPRGGVFFSLEHSSSPHALPAQPLIRLQISSAPPTPERRPPILPTTGDADLHCRCNINLLISFPHSQRGGLPFPRPPSRLHLILVTAFIAFLLIFLQAQPFNPIIGFIRPIASLSLPPNPRTPRPLIPVAAFITSLLPPENAAYHYCYRVHRFP